MIRQVGKRFTALMMVFFMVFTIISETAVTALAAENAYHAVSGRIDEILMTYLGTTDHLTEDEIGAILVDGGTENARTARAEVDALLASEEAAALTEEEIASLKEEKHQFVHFVEVLDELLYSEAMVIEDLPGLSVGGLLATYENGSWLVEKGTTIKGSVVGTDASGSGCNKVEAAAKTTTLTLTNNNGVKAILAFGYNITSNNGSVTIGGTTATGSGSESKEVPAGGSVNIVLTSGAGSKLTTAIELTGISLVPQVTTVTTTVRPATGGSITVNGEAVTAEKNFEQASDQSYTLVATPADGYRFMGWYTTAGGRVSTDATYVVYVEEATTFYPAFADASLPVFQVGSNQFTDLNEANAAAKSSGNTIILAADGTLPAGTYEISSGVKLLIPYNSSYTADFDDNITRVTTYTKPSVFRTLNMAEGAVINCYGSINVNATQYVATTRQTGHVNGPYGYINMASGSVINLENGANLYCYGYIGGSGEVVAKSGSKVYELFQIEDWRGGSNSTSLDDTLKDNAFLLSSFYVQNVEASLKVYSGATVYGVAGIDVSYVGDQHCTVAVVGTSGMFQLGSGSVATLTYDASTDRMILEFTGTLNTSSITISIQASALGKVSMDSADYILGIPSNYTVRVKEGSNLAFTSRFRLLPGTQVYIEEGAEAYIGEGGAVYLYDADDWNAGNYTYSGKLWQLKYVNAKKGAPVTRNTNSNALLQVDGTLVVQPGGALYSTSDTASGGGAGLTGSGKFISDNVTAGTSFKEVEGSSTNLSEITCIPVVGSILGHEGLQSFGTGTYYGNGNGNWYQYKITIDGEGASYTDKADTDKAEGILASGNTIYVASINGGTAISEMSVPLTFTGDACSERSYISAGQAQYAGGTLSGFTQDSEATLLVGDHRIVDVPGRETSCKQPGLTVGKQCEDCGAVTVAQTEIAALPHTVVVDAAVAPTCTTQGKTEGSHCSVCNTVILAQEEIAALGHTPGEAVETVLSEPTCTMTGEKTVVNHCTVCQEEIVNELQTIPALDHPGENRETLAAVAATCTTTGLTEGTKCNLCGDIFVEQTVIDALGHTSGEVQIENAADATCTAGGSYDEVTYCTVCNAETSRKTVTVDAKGHTVEVVPGKDATCTETGLSAGTKCSDCGVTIKEQTEIGKLPHTTESIPGKAATCTETGLTEGAKCSVCGLVTVEQQTIDALGHTEQTLPAVDATCSKTGLTEGKKCTECGEILVEQTEIGKLPHTEETLSGKAATCTTTGLTEGKKCTECGEITVAQTEIEKLPHTEKILSGTAATCTADGMTEGKICGVCDSILVAQEVIPALDHTEEIRSAVAATCTKSGLTEGKQCSVCDVITVAQTEVTALGHDYNVVVTDPTCTAQGYTTSTCTRSCGEANAVVVDDYIPAKGHTEEILPAVDATCSATGLTEGKKCTTCDTITVEQEVIPTASHNLEESPAVPPTCTEDGLTAGIRCAVCGTEMIPRDVVSATGHTAVTDKAVAATCTATGLTEGSHCSVCNEILVKQEVTDMLSHTGETVPGKAATCTATGLTDGEKCSVCGLVTVEQTVIDALGHTEEIIPAVAPTCTVTGLTEGKKCSVCGDTLVAQQIINVTDHAYDDGTVTLDPTCTKQGEQTFTCVTCGDAYTEVVAALGHDYESVVTDPTCTAQGYTTHTCTRACGETGDIVVDTYTNAIGHSYDFAVTAPTCTEDGYTTYTCSVCDSSYRDNFVGAIGHNYGSEITTAATCLVDGEKTFTCSECGDSYTEAIPATGHQEVVDPAKAATCTTAGLTKGSHCSVCNETIVAQEVINATGHLSTHISWFSDTDTHWVECDTCGEPFDEASHSGGEATCTSQASCEVCRAAYGSALGHVEVVDPAQDATCTEDGLTEGKHCDRCGATLLAQASVPAKGHHEVIDQAKAAACTETGLTEGKHCSVCGEVTVKQEVIPAKGHTVFVDVAVAPNCTTPGKTEGTHCSVCREVLVAQTEIPALGHTVVVDAGKAASCTATGLTEGSHCSVCNEVIVAQEEIPATGHTEVIDPAVEPTCTEPGKTEGAHCSVCGDELIGRSEIGAKGHTGDIIEEENRVEPTCTENGSYDFVVYCSVCETDGKPTEVSREKMTLYAQDHDYNSEGGVVTTAPTCTEQGYNTYTCQREGCGYSYMGDYVKATGHSYDSGEVTTQPTCTKEGVKTFTCMNDASHTRTEPVAMIPHADEDQNFLCDQCNADLCTEHTPVSMPAVAPTCTETGLTEGSKCGNCGDIITPQETVDALGHTEEIVPGKDATCTETGLKDGEKCSVCGVITMAQEIIPATGHRVITVPATAPDCINTGLTKGEYCGTCEEELLAQTEIPALGHTVVVDPAVKPTCTVDGLTEGSHCSVCDEVIVVQETVYAPGHTEELIPGVEATCTTPGLEDGKKCTVCGEITDPQEVIPAMGHTEEIVPGKTATCTEPGLTAGTVCYNCGITMVAQTSIPPTGHTEEIVPGKTATCTATGLTDGKKCSECNETLQGQTAIPALGHTVVIDPAVAPTCTESGLTEGKHCSVCDDVIVSQQWVNPLGHTIVVDKAVPATCTQPGKTAGEHCSVCNIVLVAPTDVAAKGHTEAVDAAVAPTCTSTGLTEGTHCPVCGEITKAQQTVPATGHSYDKGMVTTQPTCTQAGVKTITCANCGDTKTEAVAKLGHDYESVVTAPTCTEEGYTTHTCKRVCGEEGAVKQDTIVPATGHDYETVVTAPTCTEEGYTTYTCSKCEDSYTGNKVSAKGHTEETIPGTAATCTDAGLTDGKKCTVCGEITRKQTEVPAKGHTEETVKGTAATCTQAGLTEGKKCTVCGETTVEQSVIDALGHTVETIPGKDATCTEDGLMEGEKCSVCGDILTAQQVIPATGHTEVIDPAVAPTCTTDGCTEGKHCEVCGEVLLAPTKVNRTGHKYVFNVKVITKPATCTETGLYDLITSCENCDMKYTTNTGLAEPKLPHTPGSEATCTEAQRCTVCDTVVTAAKGHTEEIVPGKTATCTEPGLTDGKKCTVCSETTVEQTEIPATGHSAIKIPAVPATCTEPGMKEGQKCSVCGETLVTPEETPAAGHKESAPVRENEVAATCYAEGSYDRVVKCSVCSHEISRTHQTIAKKDHTPGEAQRENVVYATCAAAGSYDEVIRCTVEGCVGEDGEQTLISSTAKTVEKLAHTPGEVKEENRVEPPNCTTNGSYDAVTYCSECSQVISSERKIIPAKGSHEYENVRENEVAPTCSVPGSYDLVTKCKDCGFELDRQSGIVVDTTPHTEVVDPAKAPTCTETGLSEGKHCEVCDTVIVKQEIIQAAGHKSAAPVRENEVPATCYAEGSYDEVIRCAVEGCIGADGKQTLISSTPKTIGVVGHTKGEPVRENEVPATCAANGSYDEVIRCTVEGCEGEDGKQTLISTKTVPVARLDHISGEAAREDEVPATCTTNGSYKQVVRCTMCNTVISSRTETTTATGHIAGEAATCVASQVCTVCRIELAPATGHNESAVVRENVKPATCTEAGSYDEVVYCTKCTTPEGEPTELRRENKTEEAKGHDLAPIPAVPATCAATGLTAGEKCRICNTITVQPEVIPMLEHSWGAGIVTTDPTCTEPGVRTFTCTLCRNTKTAEEAPLGHQLETIPAQKPTYTADGWMEYQRCTRGECMYNTRVVIPALGEPVIDNFEDLIKNLSILESIADTYVKKVSPGKDPAELIIKYIRTGVERYNSGSWNIMAGYEDADFAKYVSKYEADYNLALAEGEELMMVTGLKNLETFDLPSGDLSDVGHIFGLMDISYTNKTSQDHADVSGWAGDTVDLLSAADQYGTQEKVDMSAMTVEEMTAFIKDRYFLKTGEDFIDEFGVMPIEGSFSHTDIRSDLDGYYIMQQLLSREYEKGMLTAIFSGYMTADLTDEQRADYFLKNRLGGVTLRSDVRDAVYNEYCANGVVGTLEGTREFNYSKSDLNNMRKAVCNVFADFLCKLAGDYVDSTENDVLTVFKTETSTLAPGVVEKIFSATTTTDNETMVYYVTTADVTRDDVHVYANYHNNAPDPSNWQMQRVLEQALAAQANYSDPTNPKYIEDFNIVAAINGDGYNMYNGGPSGLLVMEGVEYNPCNDNGFFGILTDGTAIIGSKTEYETLKSQGLVKEGIGAFGGSMLIKDGKYTDSAIYGGRASRSAVGITASGKVVFVSVDGRQIGLSCGANDAELAQIMMDAGCYWAISLDGGGSATYVSKPEGETELQVTSNPSDGAPRSVSTSLFIASTAPSSTEFDHAVIESDYTHMTVGSSVNLTAKGVSATGTPVEMPEGAVWTVQDPSLGTITQDGKFTGTALGQVVVELKLDDEVIGTKKLFVVIPDNVYFAKEKINAVYGEAVELPIRAVYEGKEVVIQKSDVVLSVANSAAGTIDGVYFTGNEASGARAVEVTGALAADKTITAKMTVNLFSKDEVSFDFENATGGDRQFAYDREVSNATLGTNNLYKVVDREQPMVTSYSFALDMSVIPIPSQLEDLTYMLPGADLEDACAWTFLLQLAERVSVLTNVTPELVFDKRFDVDYSELVVSNEYFTLDKERTTFDPETNTLKLVMNWVDQEQPIDPDTANPLCTVTGIKLTPKADADWGINEQINAVHTGEISYDIYLRANALFNFANNPDNQKIYNLYPFENTDVIINDATEKGGHFSEIYTTFEDEYTLSKSTKTGWVMEDGGWAYYESGERYTGFRTVDGLYYNFGETGINIGQKTHTGEMTIEGKNYYAAEGVLIKGWQVIDEKNVSYYNETTGVKEQLTHQEVPSTCIVNGYCDYTSETGATRRVFYDDAGGHEWAVQADGSRKCTVCGHVRVEITLDNVGLYGNKELTIPYEKVNGVYVTTYTGGARTPFTKVTAPDGSLLTNPSTSNVLDYTLQNKDGSYGVKVYDYASEYKNNTGVGTATVTVTAQRYGKYNNLNDWFGNAAGSVDMIYEIRPDLPTTVRAEDGENGLAKLTWAAAKAPGVTYVLYKSADGQNWTEFDTTENTFYELDAKEYKGFQISIRTRKVVAEKEYLSINQTVPTTVDVYLSVANNDKGQPTLKWETLYGATNFTVYRAEQADGEFVKMLETKGLTYTNTGAQSGKTYWYKVVTTLDTGKVRTSETIAITCLNVGEQVVVTAGNRADGKILLSWKAISGANGYEILRSATEDGEYTTLGTTDEISYTDLSAVAGESFFYKVKATFVGGAEKVSEAVQGTCVVPNVELNLTTGHRVDGKPTLTWSAIEGAAGYEVYFSEQQDGTYELLGDITQELTASHGDAENGKTYWYKVKVLFIGGGDYTCEAVSGTCLDPSSLFALAVTNRVDGKPVLSWNTIEGATSYEICYNTTGVEPFAVLGTTQETTFAHTDAELGKTYYYMVKAALPGGEVLASAVAHGTCEEAVVELNLSAGNNALGKPTLTWSAITDAASYEVYASQQEDTGFEKLGGTTQTTFTHETAKAGNTWYYKVKVLFIGGGEYLSDTVVATCLSVETPINVTVSNRADGKILLTWNAIEGAASYEIWRSTTEDGEFIKLDTTQEVTYADITAQVDQTFFYKVKVILTGGVEDFSNVVTGTCITPDVNWAIKPGHNEEGKPTLSWKAVEGAISYKVYRCTTEDGNYQSVLTTKGTTYTHVSATAGRTYYYKVEAIFSGGAAHLSDAVSNVCLIPGADFEITTGNNEEGKPTLEWLPLVGANQYEVWRCTTEDGKYAKVFTTNGTSYTHASATMGKTYYYYLKAIYADGTTKDSIVVVNTFYRPDNTLDVITGNNAEGKPTLSWNEITGAIKYQVWRCTTEDGNYQRVLTTTGTTYTHISATAGKTYYYKVLPVFEEGNGEFSDVIRNECKFPNAQFNLVIGHRADGKPTLRWDEIAGAERYHVLRSTTEDGTYTRVLNTAGTSYTHISATAGKTYYYQVRAIFGDGTEVDSEIVSNTCIIPGVQWDITAGHRDDGKPNLTWEHVAGAVQYEVLRSTTEDGTYAKVFTTKGTSYTHTSATAGKTYYYKVRATLTDGTTDTSDSISNTCIIPGVQWDIITGNNKDGKPTLDWERVEGAAQYEVLRATEEDGKYAKVFTTKGTSYTHTSATAGKTYYYKVRVTLTDGTKDTSDWVVNTCTIMGVVFDITTGHNAEGKPTMEWEHIEAANQYEVLRATEEDGTYNKVFTTKGTTYTHASATAGKTYYYKLRVTLNDGSKETSDAVVNSCKILEAVFDVFPGNDEDGKPTLEWEHIEGAAQYYVFRSTELKGEYEEVFATKGTSYTHENATPNRTYYYYLLAVMNDGSEVESEVFEIECQAPVDVEWYITTGHRASDGKPTLKWEDIPGAISYEVQRSTREDGTYSTVLETEFTTYTHISATAGKVYYYQIVALFSDGTKVTSHVVSNSTLEQKDEILVVADFNKETGKPQLSWSAVSGAAYEVYRSESEDGEFVSVFQTNGTSYTHETAESGVTYYYKVVAILEDGTELESVIVAHGYEE